MFKDSETFIVLRSLVFHVKEIPRTFFPHLTVLDVFDNYP